MESTSHAWLSMTNSSITMRKEPAPPARRATKARPRHVKARPIVKKPHDLSTKEQSSNFYVDDGSSSSELLLTRKDLLFSVRFHHLLRHSARIWSEEKEEQKNQPSDDKG
uniref:Uncharacterized protein n=1 Tax=Arundo donax TaxID=35708 RepID=A0A0A9GW09_ARUDO